MTVNMGSKSTVKNLITALLEMPMESEVEICIRDADGNMNFAEVFCAYTDEYNGKNTVVITSR